MTYFVTRIRIKRYDLTASAVAAIEKSFLKINFGQNFRYLLTLSYRGFFLSFCLVFLSFSCQFIPKEVDGLNLNYQTRYCWWGCSGHLAYQHVLFLRSSDTCSLSQRFHMSWNMSLSRRDFTCSLLTIFNRTRTLAKPFSEHI